MAFSLYDASVANYLQTLGAVSGFLERGLVHFRENNIDPETMVETRLAPDMLPLRFQIISVAQHSRGAIEAAQSGEFRPPSFKTPYDYAGFRGWSRRPARRWKPGRPTPSTHSAAATSSFTSANTNCPSRVKLPDVVLAAQFLFPRHHRLRHPSHQRRAARQARFHGPDEDEKG